MRFTIKQISNALFLVAFLCAILMLTRNTFGYRPAIQIAFFVTGACALLLSLIASRMEAYKEDFNVLFWIGSLVIFIGLLMKMYYLPYDMYVTIGGMAISGLSFFINPFSPDKKETDDEILDQ